MLSKCLGQGGSNKTEWDGNSGNIWLSDGRTKAKDIHKVPRLISAITEPELAQPPASRTWTLWVAEKATDGKEQREVKALGKICSRESPHEQRVSRKQLIFSRSCTVLSSPTKPAIAPCGTNKQQNVPRQGRAGTAGRL